MYEDSLDNVKPKYDMVSSLFLLTTLLILLRTMRFVFLIQGRIT